MTILNRGTKPTARKPKQEKGRASRARGRRSAALTDENGIDSAELLNRKAQAPRAKVHLFPLQRPHGVLGVEEHPEERQARKEWEDTEEADRPLDVSLGHGRTGPEQPREN